MVISALPFLAHRALRIEDRLYLLGAEIPEALRHYCHLVLGLNENDL